MQPGKGDMMNRKESFPNITARWIQRNRKSLSGSDDSIVITYYGGQSSGELRGPDNTVTIIDGDKCGEGQIIITKDGHRLVNARGITGGVKSIARVSGEPSAVR